MTFDVHLTMNGEVKDMQESLTPPETQTVVAEWRERWSADAFPGTIAVLVWKEGRLVQRVTLKEKTKNLRGDAPGAKYKEK